MTRQPPGSASAHATPRQADLTLLQADLRLAGRLDARFFTLLRALRDTGSLRRAARTAGYSYKGAWLVLEAASTQVRVPLFETATGGRGGGGSQLTAAATTLLATWDALARRHRAFLEVEEATLLRDPAIAGLLRRTGMRATARNQFAGTVSSVEIHADEDAACVRVLIPGGPAVAVATSASAVARLGIVANQEALVLVKASSVTLASEIDAQRLSADNRLTGTVARLDRGPVTLGVVLVLPGGTTVTASVAREAADALALRIGEPVTALFDATAALLAVAG
jgi:molybdate transport system regulatory protein